MAFKRRATFTAQESQDGRVYNEQNSMYHSSDELYYRRGIRRV